MFLCTVSARRVRMPTWADARLQFNDCSSMIASLPPYCIIVGVKCMFDSAHSPNGKVHHLLSRWGGMEVEGLTNYLLLNTPATTSRSAPDMTELLCPAQASGSA